MALPTTPIAAEPICDIDALKAWAPDLDTDKDDVLDRLIITASQFIEDYCGRYIASPMVNITEFYDGSGGEVGGKSKEILILRNRIDDPTTLTVKENDISLTVSQGYNIVDEVSVMSQRRRIESGRLQRRPKSTAQVPIGAAFPFTTGWASGFQNIEVGYAAGWSTIPEDIGHVACEVTWLLFKARYRIGKAGSSRSGSGVQFINELTPISQRILVMYRRLTI